MGNKSNQSTQNSVINGGNFNFEEKELGEIKVFRENFIVDNVFDYKKFDLVVFLECPIKVIEWINSVYEMKQIKKKITNLNDNTDLNFLIYMLTNYNYNDEDDFFNYQRKNIVVLLYDFFIGKVTNYEDISLKRDENPIDTKIFLQIVSYVYKIFQHFQKEVKMDVNEEKMQKMIISTLLKHTFKELEKINMRDIMSFCQAKLPNLDPYMRMYFGKIFLNTQNSFATIFPTLLEPPKVISLENYFKIGRAHV